MESEVYDGEKNEENALYMFREFVIVVLKVFGI